MANLTPAWVQVHPSYMEPEFILQYNQASGAFDTLPGGNPRVRIGSEDLAVYIKRLDVRTKMSTGQTAYNQIQSVSLNAELASTPTYLQRVRAEYDHHDTAAGGSWGFNVVEAQRLGMRMGHFQLLRQSLLYGMNPANGEGLLNANGATKVSLPPDSFGNDTVTTYDNGEMALFLLAQILALKTRTMQLGIGRKFTILGPQRTLGTFEYNIVQLIQYQRPGAGSASTAGTVKDIAALNGDEITWCYDDTLINQGAGGTTDAVLLVMPEVEKPNVHAINTNEFAQVRPGMNDCLAMYVDMAAPMEIPTPIPGGAIDVLAEMRASPGWGIRPEAITIISMAYP